MQSLNWQILQKGKKFFNGENFLYDFKYRHNMDDMGTKRNICHSSLKSYQNFRYSYSTFVDDYVEKVESTRNI